MTQETISRNSATGTAAYLYEGVIEYDAQTEGYQSEDLRRLLERIAKNAACLSTVVVLKNAHYLTTKAAALLYDYLQQNATRTLFIIVSADRARLFPPLLEVAVVG